MADQAVSSAKNLKREIEKEKYCFRKIWVEQSKHTASGKLQMHVNLSTKGEGEICIWDTCITFSHVLLYF